jgi:hypothetical protein
MSQVNSNCHMDDFPVIVFLFEAYISFIRIYIAKVKTTSKSSQATIQHLKNFADGKLIVLRNGFMFWKLLQKNQFYLLIYFLPSHQSKKVNTNF